MKKRHKTLAIVIAILAGVGISAALVLNAFRDNIVFFYSPMDVVDQKAPVDRSFRLGGLVEDGSVVRSKESAMVEFRITDTAASIPVVYVGILPDLFREGQGVVAQGRLDEQGVFQASQVLAKHDETYMPPEAADALERAARERARLATEAEDSGDAEGVVEEASGTDDAVDVDVDVGEAGR